MRIHRLITRGGENGFATLHWMHYRAFAPGSMSTRFALLTLTLSLSAEVRAEEQDLMKVYQEPPYDRDSLINKDQLSLHTIDGEKLMDAGIENVEDIEPCRKFKAGKHWLSAARLGCPD